MAKWKFKILNAIYSNQRNATYQLLPKRASIILAVLRQSVKRVSRAHHRVIARGQHSSFQRNVAAVANRWQHCVSFDRPEI